MKLPIEYSKYIYIINWSTDLALFCYFEPSNQLVVILGESNDDSKSQQIAVNQRLQHEKKPTTQ